ncbi:MAG: cupin domain-containing protein [Spirochaetales bacterium]|nr:cupin domain-containing protein [Spirochaetales bacterium]
MELKNFFHSDDIPLEDLGGGVKRRITATHDNLMCVEVHFEKGAVGALHSHPHEQITYIVSGEFEFNIGGEKRILKAGDSTFKQPDIEHGAVCLKAGMLLDIFTPCREDFLK